VILASGRKRRVPAHPRRGNIDPRGKLPQFSLYHGRDRVGSFQRDRDGVFTEYGRRGQFLGCFMTQAAACAAIERAAVS
jgi:hypothetical protein